MIPLALLTLTGCIAIGGGSDRILAGDLARAIPAFEAVPADHPVSLAPAPGVQRIFRLTELRQIARKLSVDAVPDREVCFERRTGPLDAALMLDIMQRELPKARIEIVEYSRFSVPEGEIEFPISGLRQAGTGGLWSGAVRYAGGRRFAIWARVKVTARARRVVAAEPLRAGRAIDASQLRVETRDDFPARDVYAESIEEAAGKVLRRAVPAGAAIAKHWLAAAPDVQRGDTVHVEVRSGGAILAFEGKAETTGAVGQNITVFNLESKKRFPARVESKGRVSRKLAGNQDK